MQELNEDYLLFGRGEEEEERKDYTPPRGEVGNPPVTPERNLKRRRGLTDSFVRNIRREGDAEWAEATEHIEPQDLFGAIDSEEEEENPDEPWRTAWNIREFRPKRLSRMPQVLTMRGRAVKSLTDHVGSIRDWPWSVRKQLLGRHMNNKQRFSSTVFLLSNAYPPSLIEPLYRNLGFRFDKAAWRQIRWIIQKFPEKQWTHWRVTDRRSSHGSYSNRWRRGRRRHFAI